ncbi:hypothetical protein G7B40_040585 [Aetokthonos hydrillicola Thurmond2011]|jgi:hypothetical protein|uniref:Uncharacterized protein n=1 Tax=Aetokthonos hydrillicola Thurmond2011 TaxID=2712845 RepID=A0AAP5IGP7_9CYAN|nr:hypothetical protein [Aetokthonos hydrillicola]MBO3461013.1 hypothetical protein [Aetokthonos hydrillicola CCALA 1050]MBW4588418.1 hypothetical protein [Aetokthonos hydrillicola CCALA 1050]MDR9900787.1 hypothetical protein [Aetokthonos hydrillicola Thurmond2011]
MDIYVESRTNHVDYYWVSRSTAPEKVNNVPRIIQSATKFNEDKDLKLIHESEPSIVLLRSQGELLLLVSGLRTKRQDKDRRYIRNSIAWITQDPEEELKLRKIAASVLNKNLLLPENVVSESPNSSGEYFEVNWQNIDELSRENIEATSDPPEQKGKIARFSEQRLQDLGDELKKYSLPARNGALVAVTTGFKPKAIFVKADVWRGLSNDTSLSDEWEHISQIPTPIIPQKPKLNRNLLIGLTGGAAVVVIIFILLIRLGSEPPSVCLEAFPKFTFKQGAQPQNPPTEGTDVKLGREIFIFHNKDKTEFWFNNSDSKNNYITSIVNNLQEILIAASNELKFQSNIKDTSKGKIDLDTKLAIYHFQKAYSEGNPQNKINTSSNVDTATWNALKEKTSKQHDSWNNLENTIWEDWIQQNKGNKASAKDELEKFCSKRTNQI